MKNESRSTAPDASYVNGKAYSGRMPERSRQQKKSAPPVTAARQKDTGSSSTRKARPDDVNEREQSVHHSSSHHSSSHRSHRKKKSAVKKFIRNYGPTVIALIGAMILAAVIIIISVTNKTDTEEQIAQDTDYEPVPQDYTGTEDYITLTDEEAKTVLSLPITSKYFEGGKPDVSILRDENGAMTAAVFYEYLADGSVIVEKEYTPKGLLDKKTVYDAEETGCVKSVFTVKREGSAFDGYILDEMDEAGVVKKQTEYTLTGVIDHYNYIDCNDKGQVIKETVYSAYDVIIRYDEYLYDEAGRKAEQLQYDPNYVPIGKTTWEYDESGRVVKESYFIKEVCRSYNEYEYKEDGSYIKTTYVLVDEATMTYEKRIMN